ncbi:Pex8p KNAG_0K00970 [Huiozyma naganishii CBS 8797]|uniref:Telomere-associated protein Rif1 N-terminal domain-containing protein n=1 Tax=Huiozyma naganishii (strain ATCC MYA-139 / BCRC 22969 / CBS 8797 / KCTC 17520 / NBRC 10181 / NCYC 3082 / Yp74L-3) TaxID=1071383 RepID=J7S388_HUIN7|nr:hypothetical protein KNAG_0K00970 [Kazachstania naganishii CBS 8797]CCK72462.1 hypothetical protein KNAG_0K00970 [Kazachstania naganishii CBS 8797]
MDAELQHLIVLLRDRGSIVQQSSVKRSVINNLAYYVPRITSLKVLETIVAELWNSALQSDADTSLELQEMCQSIFFWKLQISEPSLDVPEFYEVWNRHIVACSQWTVPKLAMVSGLLSTEALFLQLQNRFYTDRKGICSRYYKNWRSAYFVPLLTNYLNQGGLTLSSKDLIVQIYTFAPSEGDLARTQLHWDFITDSCIRQLIHYITHGETELDMYLQKNVNQIARTLQISLLRTDSSTLARNLEQLTKACQTLSYRECRSAMPNKSYSNDHYSGILLTVILTTKSIIDSVRNIPRLWCIQMITCLYNLHFITLDFGTTGFQTFEDVFAKLSTFITLPVGQFQRQDDYISLIKGFIGGIDFNTQYPNKINDSRLLFTLSLLERTLLLLSGSTLRELVTAPEFTFVLKNLNSYSNEIREAAHSVILTYYKVESIETSVRQWQSTFIDEYLVLSFRQYFNSELTESQLLHIIQKLSVSIPYLQTMDLDICRRLVQKMYLQFLNIPKGKMRWNVMLLKCIICMIPYINMRYCLDWLDNVKELLFSGEFDEITRQEIADSLWDMISTSGSQIAIKWWYVSFVTTPQSRL